MDKKMCFCCENIYPIEKFHRKKASPDGRDPLCKMCRNEANRESYHSDPERKKDANERSKKWAERNKERRREIVTASQRRNRHKYKPIDLEREDHYKEMWAKGELELPEEVRCHICGEIKLVSEFYLHKKRKKGYLAGCKECRRARDKDRREKLKVNCLPDMSWRTQNNNSYKYWKKHNELKEVRYGD